MKKECLALILATLILFSINLVFAECVDSDGDNYFLKGRVSVGRNFFDDYCNEKNNLMEGSCDDDNMFYVEITMHSYL